MTLRYSVLVDVEGDESIVDLPSNIVDAFSSLVKQIPGVSKIVITKLVVVDAEPE